MTTAGPSADARTICRQTVIADVTPILLDLRNFRRETHCFDADSFALRFHEENTNVRDCLSEVLALSRRSFLAGTAPPARW